MVIDHDVIDADAARAYARVFAAIRATGWSSRPGVADLLIAATAAANGLPLYTRNPSDFVGLDKVLKVIGLQALPGAMNVQKSAQ